MPYVRSRMQPASKEYARERVARNRVVLAADPAYPGVRFDGAYDWFRSAAAYASRRSYRSLDIGNAAHARREQIIATAAAMLQERADEIDAIVPQSFRRKSHRDALRRGYGRASTTREQMEAARIWFLFMVRQAERRGGTAKSRAAEIKDAAAASLIEWAEEMDRDNYGE